MSTNPIRAGFRRTSGLLLLLNLFAFGVQGQQQEQVLASIRILDSIGAPLPLAYVSISNPGNSSDFTALNTDETGLVSLGEMATDSVRIRISAMGHSPKDTVLATFGSSHLEIVLKPKIISLDEVVVAASKAFYKVGDTLEFKANVYSRGSEQVVEDLLARIPGISVGRDGEIRVRGRGVHRVLIEGDDLTGAGYKLLTKNLESGLVASVQLLESYQSNRLLGGVRDSEDIAINLKLKEEVKGTLAGTFSAAAGPAGRHDLRSNLIAIRREAKWLGLTNSNSRGYDPTGELYQFLYPENNQGESPLGEGSKAPGIFRLDFPPLAPQRKDLANSRANMASLQGVFRPLNAVKLRVRALGVADRDRLELGNRQFFQTDGIAFTNSENRSVQRQQHLWGGGVDLEYDPGGNWLLKSAFEFRDLNQYLRELLQFNADNANQEKKASTRRVTAGIFLTKKISQGSVLRLESFFMEERIPAFFGYRGPDYFSDNTGANSVIHQESLGTTALQAIRATVDQNLGKSQFSLVLEGLQQQSGISNRYRFPEETLSQSLDDLADSTLRASDKREQLRFVFKGKYGFGKWRLGGGWNTILLKNVFGQGNLETVQAVLSEPRLQLRWRPKDGEQWMLSYALDYQLTELDRQWVGPYFTGYQGLNSGTGSFETLKSHSITGSHILGDWGDNTLIRSTLILRHRPSYLGISLNRTPEFSRNLLELFHNGNSATYNFSLDQYIPNWGTNLKFTLRAGAEEVENLVNGLQRDIVNRNFGGGIQIRAALGIALEVHAGMDWTRQWTRINSSSFRDEFQGFLDVNFQPATSWSLSWKSGLFQYPQIQNSGLLLSEFQLNHKPQNGRLQYNLLLENIFNTPVYSIRYLQDTGWLETAYSLQPRRLLFQVKYRL